MKKAPTSGMGACAPLIAGCQTRPRDSPRLGEHAPAHQARSRSSLPLHGALTIDAGVSPNGLPTAWDRALTDPAPSPRHNPRPVLVVAHIGLGELCGQGCCFVQWVDHFSALIALRRFLGCGRFEIPAGMADRKQGASVGWRLVMLTFAGHPAAPNKSPCALIWRRFRTA